MITVLIVDDRKLIRAGIRRLLTEAKGIAVVGEAHSGEAALMHARNLRPDIILMDIQMPGIGGLEATRRILNSLPESRVIALSVYNEGPYPARLLKMGVHGYLTKDCTADELVQAICAVHAGKRHLCGRVATTLALSLREQEPQNVLERLSEREMQVMQLIAECFSVADIAEQLHLSPKTVNTYRYRIYEKLHIKSDVEIAVFAIQEGLAKGSAS